MASRIDVLLAIGEAQQSLLSVEKVRRSLRFGSNSQAIDITECAPWPARWPAVGFGAAGLPGIDHWDARA